MSPSSFYDDRLPAQKTTGLNEQPIPLSRPSIGEKEEELVLSVLRSGTLALGDMGMKFEQLFARYIGVDYAVSVSSGTAALHLGVRALGVEPGDEVITTPFSFIASANCIIFEKAKPVFVDIDPVTLNIDADAVEEAVTDKTKAILPVHIFGYPADLKRIDEIADTHGLGVLEDACEALGGADEDGTRIGARGNIACFGFYPNKQMTTAEGGMITCADIELRDRLLSERNQGRVGGMERVEHGRLGYNYRMSELSAALGVAQFERLDELLDARARVAALYNKRLAEIDGLLLPCADRGSARRSWFIYVVQLPKDVDREIVIRELAKKGVASKAYMPAIHLQPYYRERYGFEGGEFPVCEKVALRSLALPFFPDMTDSQVDRVCSEFTSTLARIA